MKNRILYIVTLSLFLLQGNLYAQDVPTPKSNLQLKSVAVKKEAQTVKQEPVIQGVSTNSSIPEYQLQKINVEENPETLPVKVYVGHSNPTTGKVSVERIIELKMAKPKEH